MSIAQRLRWVIIPIICILHMSISHGQDYVLEVEDMSFEEFIEHIEDLYELRVAYRTDLISTDRLTISTSASTLSALLDPIWEQYDLECQYMGERQILLRPKSKNHSISYDLKITDSEGVPLELVAVSIQDSPTGGYTDSDGSITLSTEISDPIALISLIGYKPKQVSLTEENTNITIEQASIEINDIEVADRSDPIALDTDTHSTDIHISPSSSQASSVMGQDIFRQVQLMSGVTAHNDASASIKIRGAEDHATLIVMDGMPIYNASHYYGIFSSINSSYVAEASLYKNNLPIEYGGKTSGMLSMSSHEHGESQITGILDINLLTTSLALQIPMTQQLSLAVSSRTSYTNVSETDLFDLFDSPEEKENSIQYFGLLSRDDILSSTPDFRFNDWNAKLSYTPGAAHRVDFNFYSSNDFFDDSYSNSFSGRRPGEVITHEESYANLEDWSNLGASITNQSQLSDRLKWQNLMYYSAYENDASLNISLENNRNDINREFSVSGAQYNQVQDAGWKSYLQLHQDSAMIYTLGLDLTHQSTDLLLSGDEEDLLDQINAEQTFTLFAESQIKLSKGWQINAGLRGSYYTGTNQTYLSPRISLTKKLSDQLYLKSAIGRQYQMVRQLSFENMQGRTRQLWVMANDRNIPVSSADNIMLGAHYQHGRLLLDAEAYYRNTDGVIDYAFNTSPLNNPGAPQSQNDYRFFVGSGETIGLDLTGAYTLPKYSTWLSYTLSRSTNSFNGIYRGEAFPSELDRRHQLKWVNEYNIGDFSINLNGIYSSGRPYNDLTNFDPDDTRENIRPRDRITRLPAYMRWDLGVTYDFGIQGMDAKIGISAFNLLDRANVDYLQYIFSVPSNRDGQNNRINTIIGTETSLLDRTVNLNFSLRF